MKKILFTGLLLFVVDMQAMEGQLSDTPSESPEARDGRALTNSLSLLLAQEGQQTKLLERLVTAQERLADAQEDRNRLELVKSTDYQHSFEGTDGSSRKPDEKKAEAVILALMYKYRLMEAGIRTNYKD